MQFRIFQPFFLQHEGSLIWNNEVLSNQIFEMMKTCTRVITYKALQILRSFMARAAFSVSNGKTIVYCVSICLWIGHSLNYVFAHVCIILLQLLHARCRVCFVWGVKMPLLGYFSFFCKSRNCGKKFLLRRNFSLGPLATLRTS